MNTSSLILKKSNVSKLLLFLMFCAISVVVLFPFFWMVSSSVKTQAEIFRSPPVIIPERLAVENFTLLFQRNYFGHAFFNSTYISILATVGALFFCAFSGYGFAKFEFKGKTLLFGLVLGSLMIPGEAIMVPLFQLYRDLGWIDRHIGLIVPGLANAFGVFFMTQYIRGISKEIIESGRIDGAGEITIFIRLILPLLIPAFASLGIIMFMGSWNSFLWPLIILKSPEQLTLAVALRNLQQGIRTPFHLIMAGSVISVTPLVIVFLLFQKFFISGITSGAVKG